MGAASKLFLFQGATTAEGKTFVLLLSPLFNLFFDAAEVAAKDGLARCQEDCCEHEHSASRAA
jgi:hypothetical protein